MSPILSRRWMSIALRALLLAAVVGVLWVAIEKQQRHQARKEMIARDSAVARDVRAAMDPAVLAAEEARMPRFEAYPVTETFTGTPAPVVLDSVGGVDSTDERAREAAAVLREAAAKGPNFAGHYTAVSWVDSAGDRSFAVIDARTGRVTMGQHWISMGLSHRLDSSLLIADPIGPWREAYGLESEDLVGAYAQSVYYHWDGKRLNVIDVLLLGADIRRSSAAQRHFHGEAH
jgi:hypothetical protein